MNLPADFESKTKPLLADDWTNFVAALAGDVPVSVRLNIAKSGECKTQQKVDWCEAGYYLPSRPAYTFDPLFHAGCYYPQEASSMFVEQAVRQYVQGDVNALDLCAAPGGKSTHLLSLLSDKSLLVSNEVIRSRANILAENIAKWGKPNSIVTNNDPADFGQIDSFFDFILVDAPCSGEGMFRKGEGAINEWSWANVELCRDRQRRILSDVWSSLKPQGILVYSTCTYNTEENEDNVAWMCETLGAEALALDIPAHWHVTGAVKGDLPVYRFFPHKTQGEGFFLAVLRKIGEESDTDAPSKGGKKKGKPNNAKPLILDELYRNYLQDADSFTFFQRRESWYALPNFFKERLDYLASVLKIVSCGVGIGEAKGKDFAPDHSLALSNLLNREAFVSCDVDWRTAISYLRKESLVLDVDVPKGYILLTYCNMPIGFVKNIGNRANNLYPQEWRIRTQHIPERAEPFLELK